MKWSLHQNVCLDTSYWFLQVWSCKYAHKTFDRQKAWIWTYLKFVHFCLWGEIARNRARRRYPFFILCSSIFSSKEICKRKNIGHLLSFFRNWNFATLPLVARTLWKRQQIQHFNKYAHHWRKMYFCSFQISVFSAECRSAVHCWCFSELNNKRGIIKLVSPNGKGTFYSYRSMIFLFAISVQNRILFGLCWGLTSQSTIFQSCRDGATASWVINQYFRGVKCLAQGHNTAAVGFEAPTSRSGVRHSTNEPPRSPTKQNNNLKKKYPM